MKETTKRAKHPLFMLKHSNVRTFEEWRNLWLKNSDIDVRIGLIHKLGTSDDYFYNDGKKVVLFLLDVADGYNHQSTLTNPDGAASSAGVWDARNLMKIATKAFSVLCARVFSRAGEIFPNSYSTTLEWIIEDKDLLEKIVWFFRINGDKYCTIHNYDPGAESRYDNANKQGMKSKLEQGSVRGFLTKLVLLGGWKSEHDSDQQFSERLFSLRPYLIEVMNHLGLLHMLTHRQLDGMSRKKLKEMAMRQTLLLPRATNGDGRYRAPKTIEEAVLGGSKAAQVLAIQRVSAPERLRLARSYRKSLQEVEAKKKERQLEEIARTEQLLAAQKKQLLGSS